MRHVAYNMDMPWLCLAMPETITSHDIGNIYKDRVGPSILLHVSEIVSSWKTLSANRHIYIAVQMNC